MGSFYSLDGLIVSPIPFTYGIFTNRVDFLSSFISPGVYEDSAGRKRFVGNRNLSSTKWLAWPDVVGKLDEPKSCKEKTL